MSAENATKLVYEPENKKHVYGKTDRWPGEKLLVKMINQIHEEYPGFKMVLLGTSGVAGEKFPLFMTKCHFELPDEKSVEKCMVALKESDELIRRRIDALWTWEFAWQKENQFLFFVNWYDFAFFMKHKEIFLGKDHARYALDFGLDVRTIAFEQYKVFRDGAVQVFEIDKISPDEKNVLENLDCIVFSKEFRQPRF